jgi:bifunctional non-homologous end joining protein LigD
MAAIPNRPQLCSRTAVPPSGPSWVHEVKHDGHRILAFLERGSVRLRTRLGNDATRRFAPIAAALSRLKVRSAVLDGEVAVPDERGVTHLSLLDDTLKSDPGRLAFYAFDVMFLEGLDVRRRPLRDRT